MPLLPPLLGRNNFHMLAAWLRPIATAAWASVGTLADWSHKKIIHAVAINLSMVAANYCRANARTFSVQIRIQQNRSGFGLHFSASSLKTAYIGKENT